jgi:hypothetical protein
MKNLLILVASSLFISGCGLPQFPKFPEDVKHTFVIDVNPETKEVNCLRFNIISINPVITKYDKVVDIMECQFVDGFQPKDSLKVRNYIDDVQRYSTQVKCKLK